MRTRLLFADRGFDLGSQPTEDHGHLPVDLDLPTLLAAMSGDDRFLHEVAQRVLLAPLEDPAQIYYRQRVLADCFVAPAIIRDMYATASAAVADKQGMWGYSWQRPTSTLAGAVRQLEAYVDHLRRLRRIADDHADRFGSTGLTALFAELRSQLDDEYFDRVADHLRRLRFEHGHLLSARLGPDNGGIGYVLRAEQRPEPSWRTRLRIGPRSGHHFEVAPRDEAGAQALDEITGRGVNPVANAVAQSADHIRSYFAALRAELGFYVACLNLHEALVAKGAPVVFPVPEPAPAGRFTCTGLCDAALRLRTEAAVIGNDVTADDFPLVVVTGANSGGKSTFLRSVGTAQLMMQCGMFVVAHHYRAAVATGIFTHFVRDEDPTFVHGRLDAELARMSWIGDRLRTGGLVLFNESFAATNEREGSEIARQVVQALLEAGVRVFFVTHQFDFAYGCRTRHPDATLFLRAQRRRDYKLIAAEPLPTSFGPDLFCRMGGWSVTV